MIETKYLKDNIQNIQKLMSIPALKNFETKNLGKLLKLSKIREYEDNEIIIREGDHDPWLYFILAGKIRIVKQGVEIGRIDTIGEIFGEMRIVDGLSRFASVHAVGRTTCLAVNTSAGNKIAGSGERDEKLDFLFLLYRIFAEYMSLRLRITNEELINAKMEIERVREEKMNVVIRKLQGKQ